MLGSSCVLHGDVFLRALPAWVDLSLAPLPLCRVQEEVASVRDALLGWYDVHRRHLPWRGDPPPYGNSANGAQDDNKASGKKGKAEAKGAKGKVCY